jgi:hypothetical protein
MGGVLTLVFGVMERAAQNLKRSSHVERVVAREESEQHLDDLNGPISAAGDCTHRDGCKGGYGMR